jgi:hypothetical protein
MASAAKPELLSERLKNQFAPVYLTLTSIIQGVALATLAARVEATYPGFDATNWVLVVATFLSILAIWHEYLMQVVAYVWLPGLLDSIVPFGFLATELLLVHFVYSDERAWYLAFALAFVVGGAAQALTMRQVSTQDTENRAVAGLLGGLQRLRGVMNLCILVFALAVALLYDALSLERIALPLALVALLAVIAFVGSSVPYWNRLLDYARSEHPSQGSPAADQT